VATCGESRPTEDHFPIVRVIPHLRSFVRPLAVPDEEFGGQIISSWEHYLEAMSKPHNTTGVLLTKTVAEYISVFEALEEMERTILQYKSSKRNLAIVFTALSVTSR